jgi:hypothetical protein
MSQRIRTSQVIQALTDAGFHPSEHDGDGWDPGYRVTPDGPRLVHVLHDGPGETDGLTAYTTALREAGYHVVADRPHGTRHRLNVTRP